MTGLYDESSGCGKVERAFGRIRFLWTNRGLTEGSIQEGLGVSGSLGHRVE